MLKLLNFGGVFCNGLAPKCIEDFLHKLFGEECLLIPMIFGDNFNAL